MLPAFVVSLLLLLLLLLLILFRLLFSLACVTPPFRPIHRKTTIWVNFFLRFYLEVIYTIILFVECWWLRMVFLVLLPPHTWSLASRFCGWHVVSQCNDIFEVNRKCHLVRSDCIQLHFASATRENCANAQTNQHKAEEQAIPIAISKRAKNKDPIRTIFEWKTDKYLNSIISAQQSLPFCILHLVKYFYCCFIIFIIIVTSYRSGNCVK